MRKFVTLSFASLLLVLTGCQDTSTTAPLAVDPAFHVAGAGHGLSSFAMLDDFAVDTRGATGSGKANLQENSVRVSVDAKGLLPNHDYELNITINFASFVTFTATSDRHGKIQLRGDVALDPGTHRLDFFVTHDHPTGTGVAFGLFDRDLLLRCAPFTEVTIE